MKILTEAIVSNSDMIKNYKACREKSDSFGKIFVFKNNQPDAVLFSIAEYDRLSTILEYLEILTDEDLSEITKNMLNTKNGDELNSYVDTST